MTAGHVCAPRVVGPEGTSNRILINTLKGITFEVHEVVVHQSVDLCILRLPSDLNLPALSISSTAPQIADKVFSISAPLGIAGPDMVPIFEGRYVGKVASPLGLKLDAYAIPANSGSSGGVVLNTKGEIVGMIIMARIGFENFALSVPYELLQRIFKDLESLK
jgi:S1-C subfamily serine protease